MLQLVRSSPHDLHEYRWAINIIDQYLAVSCPPNMMMSLTGLTIGNKHSSEELSAYVNSSNNIFRLFFECVKDKIIEAENVRYYLFSLVVLDQLGAAVTLAQEIKKRRPQAIIVFGGPLISRFHTRFADMPWLKDVADIIAPGEAYEVLSRILGIQHTWTRHVTPDFSDFDLAKYFSPRLVLPYLVAHGCAWGKCFFCTHHLTYPRYRSSEMKEVIGDIHTLIEKYNVDHISFSDEYLSAKQLSEMVDLLEERRLDIKWSTFVRAESRFADDQFMNKLYHGGARLLMFGFESASQRILNLMKKGTSVARYAPILKSCRKAGIATRIDFMLGFPSETIDEVRRTFSFIKENSHLIDTPFSSLTIAVFELREDAPIMNDLGRHGIRTKALLRGDLDEQYDFISDSGCSNRQKQALRHRMIAYAKNDLKSELICPRNKTHQLVLKDMYDEGCFDLPVTTVSVAEMENLWGRWNEGVEIVTERSCIRVSSYVSGGEVEMSPHLKILVEALKDRKSLYSVLLRQKELEMRAFVKVLNFLYRNEYIRIDIGKKHLEKNSSCKVIYSKADHELCAVG